MERLYFKYCIKDRKGDHQLSLHDTTEGSWVEGSSIHFSSFSNLLTLLLLSRVKLRQFVIFVSNRRKSTIEKIDKMGKILRVCMCVPAGSVLQLECDGCFGRTIILPLGSDPSLFCIFSLFKIISHVY